jgi:transposase
LAKTDSIDAEVLCAFGQAMRPQTLTASKLQQEQLRELESQRRHLSRLLVMEQNRGARLKKEEGVKSQHLTLGEAWLCDWNGPAVASGV